MMAVTGKNNSQMVAITALPHLRLPGLLSSELVLVRVHDGMQIVILDEFGEEMSQDQPVYALFFLLSSEENPGQHLRILTFP